MPLRTGVFSRIKQMIVTRFWSVSQASTSNIPMKSVIPWTKMHHSRLAWQDRLPKYGMLVPSSALKSINNKFIIVCNHVQVIIPKGQITLWKSSRKSWLSLLAPEVIPEFPKLRAPPRTPKPQTSLTICYSRIVRAQLARSDLDQRRFERIHYIDLNRTGPRLLHHLVDPIIVYIHPMNPMRII